MSSGQIVRPTPPPLTLMYVILSPGIYDESSFNFEPVEGEWGYIRHIATDRIIQPYLQFGPYGPGNLLSPDDNTRLVLENKRHAGALFAMDEKNNRIIHKGGKYISPFEGHPLPLEGTQLVLHGDRHDAMKFQFVSPSDANQEVLVYGKPTVSGSWKIINAIINPKAKHVYSLKYTVGKSQTESTTTEFRFSWETSVDVQATFLSASTKMSLSNMVQRTSSTTWKEETTAMREITG